MQPQDVIRRTAEHFRMTEKAILGRGRFARVVIARHVAMWICRNYCNMSYPEIGAVFGRNHTTIISAVRNVDEMRSWGLAEVVDACRVAVHRATADSKHAERLTNVVA